jgi:tRNA (mo5U34)-methyltransferase
VIDYQVLFDDLDEAGLGRWQSFLLKLLPARFADGSHGDLRKWQAAIDALPDTRQVSLHLQCAAPGGACVCQPDDEREQIRRLLLELQPWRKGPFNVCGVTIDAEWRSDRKWQRLAGEISPLVNRKVLDVGCGNGYYALRMQGEGARLVVGIDPTLLFVCQFLALRKLLHIRKIHVLPLRLHELPLPAANFDTTFAMGVLYHQRNPQVHLAQLRSTLRPGGELVLETLVLPGDNEDVLRPGGRYARMRNVWHLPTVPALIGWLLQAGFRDLRVIDVSMTSVDEQRPTDWMRFESLAEALDPRNPRLTVEGLPAPTRAVVVGSAPDN